MADGQESYVISLETQEFLNGADAVIRKFKNIEGVSQEAGKIIDAVLKSSKPAENFTKALDHLNGKIDEFKASLKEAEKAEKDFEKNQDVTGLENQKKATEELRNSLDELQGIYETVASASEYFAESCEQAAEAQEEQSAAMEKSASSMQRMIGGQETYNAVLSTLPPEISNVIKGIDGMITSSLTFLATPLGAALGAIALALAALYTYFKKTEEGEDDFVRVTGYVDGMVAQLTDDVAELGRTIRNAFEDPLDSLSKFGRMLEDQVLGRFKAMWNGLKLTRDMINSIINGEFDAATWQSYLDRASDNTKQMIMSGDWQGHSAKMREKDRNAQKNAELEARQKVLNDFRDTRWKVLEVKLDNKIAEKRNQISTTSDPVKKAKLEAEAQELISQKYKMKVSLAKEDLKVQQEKMKLTNNTAADYAKEADLQAELLRMEGERLRESRYFERQAFSAEKAQAAAAKKSAKELAKEQANAAKEKNNLAFLDEKDQQAQKRESRRLALQIEEAHAQGLEEGHEKTLELIRIQGEKELMAIEEQRDNALLAKVSRAKQAFDADKSNQGKVFDMTSVQFTDEEIAQWDKLLEETKAKIKKQNDDIVQAEKDAMNKYLIQYGTYQERKTAIQYKYEQARKKAETEGEKKILTKQEEEELDNLKQKFGLATAAFADLFADASKKSVSEIQKIIDKYKMLVDFMQGGGLTGGEIGVDENGKKRKKTTVTRDDLIKAGFTEKDLANITPEQIEKISKALKVLNGDLANKSPWKAFEEAMAEAIEELNKGNLAGGIQGIVGAIKSFMPAVENFANSVDNLFGGSNGDSIKDYMKGLDGLMTTGQSFAQFAQRDYIGGAISLANGLSTIKDAISGVIDRKHERRIKQLQDYIDNLEKSYGDLEKAVSKTYSKARQTNIEAEISNRQEQINAIQKQIQEERDKKKTDNGRISEWEDRIKGLQDQIAVLKEEAKDALFGSDIQSAIESFADAWTSAWESGTSSVRTAKQQVREMMKAMVKESIKSALEHNKAMENIRAKLAEFWADEYLSDTEQKIVEGMAEKLDKDLSAKYGWADRLWKEDYTQSGTTGGFATASQDSVDELNGRFTAVQMNTNSLVESVAAIQMQSAQQSESLASIRQNMEQTMNISREGINHLANIEKYTSNLVQMNERLDQIERNTRAL